MEDIFSRSDKGVFSIITSVLTVTEVLTKPLQTNHFQYENRYRNMLIKTHNITTLAANLPIAEQAARLRAKYSLKTPNAFQVATSILAGCDAFLTNDKRLKQITEINILVLDELELDLT